LLRSDAAYRKMTHARNPFGDGRASTRIVAALRQYLPASVPQWSGRQNPEVAQVTE
jgi:UDP-N-acetylglucosamine 2-epimerase